MNLIENEEINKKNKKTKVVMIVIIVLVVLLLILSGVLLYMINNIQKNTLKLNIDNKAVNFASDMFVIENNNVYVSIKDFSGLLGYSQYNGDLKTPYTEDNTNCYIDNKSEAASYALNSSTMYKKVATNEDYEYFELDEPVRLINNKLYTTMEGIQTGTNSMMQYDSENNQITVFSLEYVINQYIKSFPTAAIVDEKADFNNKKALRYGMVVVMSEDEHYGVYNSQGQEIIGTKYANISFKEDSQEFTVKTDDGKMGILSSDGRTKIEPNYDEIKQISSELNYYLVSNKINNNKKYGVINQNGNIVIYLEYDKIGVDEKNFFANGLNSPYILFDNVIPVQQNKKWGLFDINGKQIIPVEYDQMGYIGGTSSNKSSNNVLIIPQYEAIVLGKEKKYKIVSSLGEEYVPLILDSVYSITTSGQDKYYMTFTRKVEEDGKMVDKTETYDVDEYFEKIVKPSTTQEENTQTNTVDNTTTNTVNSTTNTTNQTENQNQNQATMTNAA